MLLVGLLVTCSILCRLRESQGTTKVKRRPPLRRGRVSPTLPVPDDIPKPPYVATSILPEIASEYQFPGSEGIAAMKAACELAARVLDNAGKLVRVSFLELTLVNAKLFFLFSFRKGSVKFVIFA